ncbi:XK-related protein 4-like [Lytechinus variegatus]|uniref:XK-related protein 4-like n=1 Tax=Lytechinus variegatus TaxID=7654 RepID=UPI001BB1827D|nr:XK-related protein 4-like [Lytechinus variegatus]
MASVVVKEGKQESNGDERSHGSVYMDSLPTSPELATHPCKAEHDNVQPQCSPPKSLQLHDEKHFPRNQDDPGISTTINDSTGNPISIERRCDINQEQVQTEESIRFQGDNQEESQNNQEDHVAIGIANETQPSPPVESRPNMGRFSNIDATFVFVGISLYIADLVTDILVGVQYLRQGDILWSVMTFVFVLVPSLVLQYFSFRWFILDLDDDTKYKSNSSLGKLWAWFEWLLTHVLQLAAIIRYCSVCKFGMRSRTDAKYYRRMISERHDVTMLRLLESFMESAPQLVLQVYIMVEEQELYWLTATSAIVSLLSLCFSLGIYQKALRDNLEYSDPQAHKGKLSYGHVVLLIVWRLFTITSRVLAMALFGSIYEWWVFVLAAAHWAVMTAWLIWQDTSFHESKYDEIPFDAVIGIVHIFCFFNMKEGPTRYRAIIFYVIVFIENTVMFGFWYAETDSQEERYGLPALVFVWGGFFVGIFFMLLYYYCFHPEKIHICLCKGTSAYVPNAQRGEVSDADVQRGAGDETDGSIVVDGIHIANPHSLSNVGRTVTSTETLSGDDRYRYLFSYRWRRRIHPKI